jgi:predicted phosphodiesterase
MRYAIISDIHGNLQALKAVLTDIDEQKIEQTFFLGDAVGYGANPNEVVELLAHNCDVFIMGNHDAGVLGLTDSFLFNDYARKALSFTGSVLNESTKAVLSQFEMLHGLDDTLLTHATPDNPEEWRYCITPAQAAEQFEYFSEKFCFVGHSHWPIVFYKDSTGRVGAMPPGEFLIDPDSRYLFNVGSVGQPRDGDARACYVIFDKHHNRITYRRVSYDISAAQQAMAEQELPKFLIERLAGGR